jgi:hypothetical protein
MARSVIFRVPQGYPNHKQVTMPVLKAQSLAKIDPDQLNWDRLKKIQQEVRTGSTVMPVFDPAPNGRGVVIGDGRHRIQACVNEGVLMVTVLWPKSVAMP